MDDQPVSMVIPGRNSSATVGACLDAAVGILERAGSALREIIFVDDGSADGTQEIVAGYPAVTLIRGSGHGAGSARNLGWRAAAHERIWFVDSDCVAAPDALDHLVPFLDDAEIGAVGGSYGIMNPSSLLACLIHEEIVERHCRMSTDVNFLATFNVLYRREALRRVDGFDERFLKGQDADLAYRVMAAGYRLRFTMDSRVGHYHEDRLGTYLEVQRQQGYWRVWLHLRHPGHTGGDSYSGLTDHLQPPCAVLTVLAIPLLVFPHGWLAPSGFALLLAVAQAPMTWRLMRRGRRLKYVLFAPMSFARAFWRGAGMTAGVLRYTLDRISARGE